MRWGTTVGNRLVLAVVYCNARFYAFQNDHRANQWPEKAHRGPCKGRKSPKKIEMAASVLPASNAYNDVRVKYHSVSGGSALSQSMKYAEAWLYGSLSVRMGASRSALFDCDDGRKRGARAPVCRCATARLFEPAADGGAFRPSAPGWHRCESESSSTMTTTSSSSSSSTSPPPPPPASGFGTVGRRGGPLSKSRSVTAAVAVAVKQPLTDPYDAVRRSRLGFAAAAQRPARAKSHSPSDRDRHDTAGRKSILDCDLSAYDLLRRNGGERSAGYASFSDEDERHVLVAAAAVASTPAAGQGKRKKRQRKLTFGYKSRTKLKEAGEKLSSALSPLSPSKKNDEKEATFVDDVSIAGQKIRIFNAFDRTYRGADAAADDWVSDPNDETCTAVEPEPEDVEVTLAKDDLDEAVADHLVDAHPQIDCRFPDRGE